MFPPFVSVISSTLLLLHTCLAWPGMQFVSALLLIPTSQVKRQTDFAEMLVVVWSCFPSCHIVSEMVLLWLLVDSGYAFEV